MATINAKVKLNFEVTPEELARDFHTFYEELAPDFGYETREATRTDWDNIPADTPNKQLMVAVSAAIIAKYGVVS